MRVYKPIMAILLAGTLGVVNANAIGKREQGVLIGAGAMLLLPSLLQGARNLTGSNNNQVQQPSVVYMQPQQPMGYQPPPPQTTVIYQQPVQKEVVREIIYVNQPPQQYGNGNYQQYNEPYRRKTIILER